MAQEVVPLLGQQLALGLKLQWVVPETTEKHLSSAFAGLTPVLAPPEQLIAALIAAGCRQVILVPDDRTNTNQNDLIDQLVGADIAGGDRAVLAAAAAVRSLHQLFLRQGFPAAAGPQQSGAAAPAHHQAQLDMIGATSWRCCWRRFSPCSPS
jgi:hypothetical protein